MSRPVTVYYTAAGPSVQAYTVPEENTLVGFLTTLSSLNGLSWDPSRVQTDWTTPPAAGFGQTDIIVTGSNVIQPLNIPVSAGEVIFCVFKSATPGIQQLFFAN